jgi:type I restriction enzyme S subunit
VRKVNWPLVRLGDFVSIKHGYPFKSQYMSHNQPEMPIVVGIGNYKYTGGFRFAATTIKTYTGDFPAEFILKPDDILLVMTCQTPGGEILGIPGRIPNDGKVYLHNQRMGKVVITNRKRVNHKYLYWLFLSRDFNQHLVASASGAKILHTAPERIEAYKFHLPPLPIQRKIAGILSAYDDLIENNTRRIAILEEMARTLYHEWFVKFRFPGYEQKLLNNLENTLPEGWYEVSLADVCSITMGQSPSSEFYNQLGDGLPFHQGVSDFGDRFPTDRVYCTLENRIAKSGDILFSVRAPVGRINISTKKIVIGRGLCAIHSKTNDQEFIFQQLKELFQEEDKIGNGSIFKAVTKEDIYNIKLIWPSEALLHDFKMHVQPIFSSLKILYQKNDNLRRTRDLLLPKLISGEIDVSSWVDDEEREQEEVVASEVGGVRAMKPAQPIDVAAMQQRMLWE